MKYESISAFFALTVCLLTAGCEKKTAAGGAGGGPPPTQVVVAEAKEQPVAETLSLVGSVVANERVEIYAEADGVVQEILFEEGQIVKKGQLIIRLDETKFAAALAETEANFKLSEANFERAKELYREKLVSHQEYDQAAATFAVNRATIDLRRRQLQDARIYAPFSGVTGARNVSPGAVVSVFARTPLTSLVDLDPVKVEVNVPERFLGQLKIGQTLELNVAAFPGRNFKGEVFFITPTVDPATRTALVKARVPNPSLELKPGMFASLELTLQIRERAVVIPETALVANGDRLTIYIVDAEQKAQLRPVTIGVRISGLVEVANGLKAGERVIVEGLQKVRPGGPVQVSRGGGEPVGNGRAEQVGKRESEKVGTNTTAHQ